jgi:glucan 1,3-beta-glucosidase
MSNYTEKYLSLAGIDASNLSTDDLRSLARNILDARIHGISFSPYLEGQGPGTQLCGDQIEQRLEVIRPHVNWVRSFSCTEGNELIPGIAAANGLKTMVGVWLSDDLQQNEEELANAIAVAQAGHANILAVGNEVLLRGDLSEDALIDYIRRAKEAAPTVDVGYVDAYFEFVDHPRVTACCDVLLANCYPFWEGCPVEHSLLYMKDMYRRVVAVAGSKKVIVSETGWPTLGTPTRGAVPSYESAIQYFINAYQWAREEGVDIFYFSAFDESWKVDSEGDVGAYWGLWDKDGQPKF